MSEENRNDSDPDDVAIATVDSPGGESPKDDTILDALRPRSDIDEDSIVESFIETEDTIKKFNLRPRPFPTDDDDDTPLVSLVARKFPSLPMRMTRAMAAAKNAPTSPPKAKKTTKKVSPTSSPKIPSPKVKKACKGRPKAKGVPVKAKAASKAASKASKKGKEKDGDERFIVLETLIQKKDDEISKLAEQNSDFANAIDELSSSFQESQKSLVTFKSYASDLEKNNALLTIKLKETRKQMKVSHDAEMEKQKLNHESKVKELHEIAAPQQECINNLKTQLTELRTERDELKNNFRRVSLQKEILEFNEEVYQHNSSEFKKILKKKDDAIEALEAQVKSHDAEKYSTQRHLADCALAGKKFDYSGKQTDHQKAAGEALAREEYMVRKFALESSKKLEEYHREKEKKTHDYNI